MKYTLSLLIAIGIALVTWSFCLSSVKHVPANDKHIYYNGRIDFANSKQPSFYYPGTEIIVRFSGTTCSIDLGQESLGYLDDYGNAHTNFYTVLLNGVQTIIEAKEGLHTYKIEKKLKDTIHTLQIWKRTEAICGKGYFGGIRIDNDAKLFPVESPKLKIEFIGNSITCGYGLEGDNAECKFTAKTENNYLSYGAIVARNLNAEYRAIAYSGKGVFQNYGGGREEVMPELYERTNPFDEDSEWNFSKWIPDIVVVNLGTNDFSSEIPDSLSFVQSYSNLLNTINRNYPKAQIVCLLSPMLSNHWPIGIDARINCGKFIQAAISVLANQNIHYSELSVQGDNGYGCDYHPNKKQHEVNAEELTRCILREVKR
jgi:lysophospholipase L1-like esterase